MDKIAIRDVYQISDLEVMKALGIKGNRIVCINYEMGTATITVSRGVKNE